MNTRSGKTAEEYRRLDIPSQLASSTGDFRKIDVNSLQIQFLGTGDPRDIFKSDITSKIPDYFYIKNYDENTIRNILYESETSTVKLTKKEKTLAKYLQKIVDNEKIARGTSESNTDSLVDYILRKLELDEDPFLMRIQPNYKFYVHNKEISSNPEFSVEKDDLVVFIDEDKHIKNIGPSKNWGENQIAGEILAAASTNYNDIFINRKRKLTYQQVVYSMRVIGTRFTFYKATIPNTYLESLGDGFPEESFTIYRFPDNEVDKSLSNYNYMIPEEREIIVNMLFKLHDTLGLTSNNVSV